MSTQAALLGRWGEALVGKWLTRRGYTLLASGYRCRMGEIDLIARKGNTLAFVEVKLRRTADFAAAREQVTPAKQRRIRTTAQLYLAQNPALAECFCRFDVAEVYAPQGTETKHPDINYLENAFW